MPRQATIELDGEPACVAAARRFVITTMTAWDHDDLAEVAVLLTSELVTNAIRHAHGVVTVGVAERRGVLVEVVDGSTEPPRARRADAAAEGGRGLHLLDALASKWGWRPRGRGKVVWFTVAPGATCG